MLTDLNLLQFSDIPTNTQGFIVRDDSRKEIVVSFRGSFQLQDFVTGTIYLILFNFMSEEMMKYKNLFADVDLILQPFNSPGISASLTKSVSVHQGFLTAFNSVASFITSQVAAQLEAHPGYALVSTGHSLGGGLASLGAVSLAANFPGVPLRMFTFGQPRTGNAAYAALAEQLVGVKNIFRGELLYNLLYLTCGS